MEDMAETHTGEPPVCERAMDSTSHSGSGASSAKGGI